MPIERFRFEARIDQMRSLKHGDNDALLNTWVGKIFSTSQLLDDEAIEALIGLSSHPYLPDYGVSKAVLPTQIVTDLRAVEVAAAHGYRLENIDPGLMNTVRSVALAKGAPLEVHAWLTQHGVPEATLADIKKAARLIIDNAEYNALEYLRDATPQWLEVFAADPAANKTVVKTLFQKMNDWPIRLNRFLDTWETRGGDLETHLSHYRKNAQRYTSFLAFYDGGRAQRRAGRLDLTLPEPVATKAFRPRF